MAIEWWVVIATLAGPVVAVQTQKWIEWATARRDSRRRIFTALMANRATRLNDDYVRALNMISLEFGRGSKKDRPVLDSWKALFGELNQGIPESETDVNKIRAWNERVSEKHVDLLSDMSIALGYDFSKEELRRGTYYPQGRADLEQAQLALIHGVRAIVEGKAALPMNVIALPGSEESAKLQISLNEKLISAYDEDGALKVRMLP